MSKHERTMRINAVDDNGVFQMTLATEGEASDGDILSMAGGKIPERMPLLLSHWNDPTALAGSVTNPEKQLDKSPPRLRATGQIEMGGVGALADIRRDVAFMTNKHGAAVSIRWDEVEGGKPPVRRVNLSSDHPAFVDAEKETSWKKRAGWFWPEWKALEGSIVALGADPSAVIGGREYAQRADETEGAVSEFWRAMAEDARHESDAVAMSDGTEHGAEYGEEETVVPTPGLKKSLARVARMDDGSEPAPGHTTVLEFISKRAQIARDLGVPPAELINAVTLESDGEDFTPVTIGDEEVFLPQRLADQLAEERADRAETPALEPEPDTEPEPEPVRVDQPAPLTLDVSEVSPPIDVDALGKYIGRLLDESEERTFGNVRKILNSYTGKVK
jgi:hypothetical protein